MVFCRLVGFSEAGNAPLVIILFLGADLLVLITVLPDLGDVVTVFLFVGVVFVFVVPYFFPPTCTAFVTVLAPPPIRLEDFVFVFLNNVIIVLVYFFCFSFLRDGILLLSSHWRF